MKRRTLVAGAAAALLAGVGAAVYLRPRTPATTTTEPVAAGATMALVDVDGTARTLDEWRGQVLLLNFWATWCAPCREEIPTLMRMRDELRGRGFEVVGVAIDRADPVRRYTADMAINYPILVADPAAIGWMQRLGNRAGALPFSVVVGRDGLAAAQHLGLLSPRQARDLVAPALGR